MTKPTNHQKDRTTNAMAYDTILAYAYEAAYHCVPCTRYNFTHAAATGVHTPLIDANGLAIDQEDDERNVITPIFSITEVHGRQTCFNCREEIEQLRITEG